VTRVDDPLEIAPLGATAEEEPALTEELLDRYRTHRPVRGVTVTDLLDPRGAYWRSVRAVPPTPEEAARLREGQELHERLGRRLAPAHSREVRVRRHGIVGRIDVLDGRPVELKSTASPPRPDDDLRESRPSYVEQLAMYGALAGVAEGRLIVVRAGAASHDDVGVWDVRVGELEAVDREMARRAVALRAARETSDVSGLPRCAWFDRSCPFRSGGLCDCTGSEEPLSNAILEQLDRPRPNRPEAERVAAWLAAFRPEPGSFARFRELAYPRRAYFDGLSDAPPDVTSRPPESEADETWSALQAVLEGGPSGEFELRHSDSGEPAEAVTCFRGEPCLVKSSRAARPTPADRVVRERPHYVLELALRCAALGSESGYLFFGFERVPSEGPWIHAQRVRFGSREAVRALLARRAAALTKSRELREPSGLPACPRWMSEDCRHREVCGCATDAGPSAS
jgi:hypothetical protein